mgnify:CR=1 FL=1|jgi:hypothetical protein
MSNTRTLELDISKEGAGTCIKVGQGDDGGTTIKALIYDNGAEFALSGSTVWLVVLLPNRRNYYRGQCSVSGNAATITVDESKLCSVPGYTDEAYFTITKSGATYSTERFAIEILRSALDSQQPAQNWDDAVQDLIDRGETAVKNANSAASAANTAAGKANTACEHSEQRRDGCEQRGRCRKHRRIRRQHGEAERRRCDHGCEQRSIRRQHG